MSCLSPDFPFGSARVSLAWRQMSRQMSYAYLGRAHMMSARLYDRSGLGKIPSCNVSPCSWGVAIRIRASRLSGLGWEANMPGRRPGDLA